MDEACQWQALDDGPSDSVGRFLTLDFSFALFFSFSHIVFLDSFLEEGTCKAGGRCELDFLSLYLVLLF
jgi:hypothetical protein